MMIDDRYYHLTQMSNIGVIPFPLSTLTKCIIKALNSNDCIYPVAP